MTKYAYRTPLEGDTLGFHIRRLREERGWSQEVLAENADLTQSQISAYERSQIKGPDPAALARIEDAFNVTRGSLGQYSKSQAATRRVLSEAPPPPGSIVIPDPSEAMSLIIDMVSGMDRDQERRAVDAIRSVAESTRNTSPQLTRIR